MTSRFNLILIICRLIRVSTHITNSPGGEASKAIISLNSLSGSLKQSNWLAKSHSSNATSLAFLLRLSLMQPWARAPCLPWLPSTTVPTKLSTSRGKATTLQSSSPSTSKVSQLLLHCSPSPRNLVLWMSYLLSTLSQTRMTLSSASCSSLSWSSPAAASTMLPPASSHRERPPSS